ncbi:hypothetical protein MASR2M117_26180 [Paludibacter sp.]
MKQTNNIISVVYICGNTFTNQDGMLLRDAMATSLDAHDVVVIDFHGISSISTSFINSSFGDIADQLGIDALRRRVKLVNYTSTIMSSIRKYVDALAFDFV